MPRKVVTFVIATTIFFVTPAQADDQGNFYVGAGLGFVFAGNTRANGVFTSTGTAFDGKRLGTVSDDAAKGDFDSGFSPTLTVGYDMGDRSYGRLRFEAELFTQKADTDKYTGEFEGSPIDPPGKVNTTMTGVVLNALYGIGRFSSVQPYVYAGYGLAKAETEYDFQGEGQVKIDGSVAVLQAGFGVDIPFNDRTAFDLKYRFRRAGLNEGGLDTDIDAQILEFGVRYAF